MLLFHEYIRHWSPLHKLSHNPDPREVTKTDQGIIHEVVLGVSFEIQKRKVWFIMRRGTKRGANTWYYYQEYPLEFLYKLFFLSPVEDFKMGRGYDHETASGDGV
jgi:hypothetical protein